MRLPSILLVFFIFSFEFLAQAATTNEDAVLALVAQAVQAQSEAFFDAGLKNLAHENFVKGLASSEESALDELIGIVDAEQWTLSSQYKFHLLESLIRNQGLVSDGKNFWFSGTYSLEKVKSKTGVASLLKAFPLPKDLMKVGDDHVGDIDLYDGTIYAPAEDGGNHYKNPYVVLYDAEKLYVKEYFRLPVAPQAEGVPWVAVDAAHGRAFSSMYYNVTQINVYDLKTFALIGEIPLSSTIHNWQGAKVHDGFLYATEDSNRDGKGKDILKINLETGTVIPVAVLPADVSELEGLTFSSDSGVDEMDVLAMSRHGKNKLSRTLSTRSYLEMYKKTSPSLRDQMRQAIFDSKRI